MEDKNINLKLILFEDKEAKTGLKYTRFKTSEGWMACFDEQTNKSLQENIGSVVNVDIQIDDSNRKKIAVFNEVVDNNPMPEVEEIKINKEADTNHYNDCKKCKLKNNNKNTTMYTSYAKDIFTNLNAEHLTTPTPEDLMTKAIALVKQAKEAFE